MNTIEKLKILSEDSRYDMACACGSGNDDRRKRGLDGKWLYPVTLPNGGYSILLKTLLSNSCLNDCKYCPIRSDADIQRCTLKPEETADLFMAYVKKKMAFGLFLSSGIINNPDYTMSRINAVSRLLRYKHRYKGYIHLKIIPGASDAAIEDSISLASAVSLNIETPGKERFDLLSDKKNYIKDIIHPIKLISRLTSKGNRFSGVKSTTQFIVGASNETDSEIIKYMLGLYKKLNFQRVYFSAYQKGLGHYSIPGEQKTDSTPEQIFMREHRLYQVDYLIRKYRFSGDDIVLNESGNLDLDKDPKETWAGCHPEFYPVRINKADEESLLRVPGIGPVTADIIIKMRRHGKIKHLEDLGIKGKRLDNLRKYAVIE